jgi:hypothetical protein
MSFGFDAGREIGVPVLSISACGLIERGLVPFKHDCTRRGSWCTGVCEHEYDSITV